MLLVEELNGLPLLSQRAKHACWSSWINRWLGQSPGRLITSQPIQRECQVEEDNCREAGYFHLFPNSLKGLGFFQ